MDVTAKARAVVSIGSALVSAGFNSTETALVTSPTFVTPGSLRKDSSQSESAERLSLVADILPSKCGTSSGTKAPRIDTTVLPATLPRKLRK